MPNPFTQLQTRQTRRCPGVLSSDYNYPFCLSLDRRHCHMRNQFYPLLFPEYAINAKLPIPVSKHGRVTASLQIENGLRSTTATRIFTGSGSSASTGRH
jgi:hypothetical protein